MSCRTIFNFERLKSCGNGIPSDEKEALKRALKAKLRAPIDNEKFCIETPHGKYKVRIAIVHPDGVYTIRQHDIETVNETIKYKNLITPLSVERRLLTPLIDKSANLEILDVLCSPGRRKEDTYLAITAFRSRSPKLESISLPKTLSKNDLTNVLDKIKENNKNKSEIERILTAYSLGGSSNIRYEKCTVCELKEKAARRKINVPSSATLRRRQ